MEPAAARRLLAKLRRFVEEELSPDERELFAVLIAPGVAQVYAGEEEAAEVEGFGLVSWSGREFPAALAEALRYSGIRVVGLDPE